MIKSNRYVFTTLTILMSLYWFGNAFILTYANIFLLSKGLSNTEVGIVLAGGALLSILFQGVPSSLHDRVPGISLKLIMALIVLMELFMISNIIFFSANKFLLITTYALLEGCDWAFLAFINSTSMEYLNYGYKTNFSVIRSCGSIFYGIATLLLGLASQQYGLNFLMPCLFGVRIITLLCISALFNPSTPVTSSIETEATKANDYTSFFAAHPQLPLLLFGFFCLWISGTSTNNFIIHIINKVGGNKANMGFITSTSAWLEVPFMLLCGLLLKRYSCTTLLRVSAFFYIVKPIVMLLSSNVYMVALGQYMQGPSYALFAISSVYYMNQIVSPKDIAKAQAILGICTKGTSGIAANLLSGILLDKRGIDGMLLFCIFCTICGFSIINYFTNANKAKVSVPIQCKEK